MGRRERLDVIVCSAMTSQTSRRVVTLLANKAKQDQQVGALTELLPVCLWKFKMVSFRFRNGKSYMQTYKFICALREQRNLFMQIYF